MKHKTLYPRIRLIALLFASTWFMTGCADHTDPLSPEEPGETINNKIRTAYVSVVINTLSQQNIRSNPNGGQEGDGSENAFENEDQINNLTVLFFQGTDLNSSLNTPIQEIIYLGANQLLPGNVTRVQKIELEKEIYNILLLTNTGNISAQLRGKTVQEVCDYIQTKAWTFSGSDYTDFIMTSAIETSIDLTQPTSATSPAVAYVDIQRMAARIDVLPNQGENATNTYPVYEGNDLVGNVIINRIRLVNRLSAGSYLMKRTAANLTDAPEYLGEETPQSGKQTNYVIDPWTTHKTKANLSGGNFDPITGGSGSSPATSLYTDYFTNVSFTNSDTIRSPLTGKNYYILGYTLENTMDQDAQLNGYTTGVVYETTYIPSRITNYDANNPSNVVIDNSQKITFFTTSNNQIIHNSLESVEFPFLNGAQPDDFFSYTFSTGNTWQELKNYSDRILENDVLGFKTFLNTLLQGKTLTDNLTQDVSWAAYVLDTFGYSYTSEVILNQGGKNTIQLLNSLGIKAYQEGLAYYPYWIRHSNDNTIQSAVMEFGIVRNNIYKLRVLSFSGLGKPEPYDPGTDNPENPDEESHIRVLIWVRPWHLRLHPEIVM